MPPLSVTVPLWVPVVKVPVVALNVIVLVPVPATELSDNQAALSLAVQLKVPPPVLLMLRV